LRELWRFLPGTPFRGCFQGALRLARAELVKAILLATAFLFWAANQLWPHLRQATLFNDIAIALFVFDIFLVMIGWPATSPDGSFAESDAESAPATAALSAAERNTRNCGLS